MKKLSEQYSRQYIPMIKAIIVEMQNETDDMKVQTALRKAFPGKVSNLLAVRAWEVNVRFYREQFYKKNWGNKNEW